MLSFRKIATPTLAALLMFSVPAFPALAADAASKPAPQKTKEAKTSPTDVVAKAKTSPTDVMAKINGTPITRRELDRAVKVMLAQNHMQQPLQPEVMKQANEAALEQLISAELLYQHASKEVIKDLDKQVDDKVAQNRAKFSSDDDYQKALQGVDMTVQDMKDFTRKDIVIANFIEKRFVSKGSATTEEAKKFYEDNLDKYFKKPETVRASHILVGVDEKASAEEHKKAKEKAEALLKRVKAGEDFAAIAKAESTCPSSAQGGDLGEFGHGQMVEAFDKAAFALKPGQTSGIVETQFGYHIIKLTEKHEASTQDFESVKGKIIDYLKREKVQKELNSYLAELKKNANIEKM